MRIITVNLPTQFIEAIDSLTGENALYPSRSELIRVAIREFLIREIRTVNMSQNIPQKPPILPNAQTFIDPDRPLPDMSDISAESASWLTKYIQKTGNHPAPEKKTPIKYEIIDDGW